MGIFNAFRNIFVKGKDETVNEEEGVVSGVEIEGELASDKDEDGQNALPIVDNDSCKGSSGGVRIVPDNVKNHTVQQLINSVNSEDYEVFCFLVNDEHVTDEDRQSLLGVAGERKQWNMVRGLLETGIYDIRYSAAPSVFLQAAGVDCVDVMRLLIEKGMCIYGVVGNYNKDEGERFTNAIGKNPELRQRMVLQLREILDEFMREIEIECENLKSGEEVGIRKLVGLNEGEKLNVERILDWYGGEKKRPFQRLQLNVNGVFANLVCNANRVRQFISGISVND